MLHKFLLLSSKKVFFCPTSSKESIRLRCLLARHLQHHICIDNEVCLLVLIIIIGLRQLLHHQFGKQKRKRKKQDLTSWLHLIFDCFFSPVAVAVDLFAFVHSCPVMVNSVSFFC